MKTSGLDWAVATVTIPGETESGDLHVVEAFVHGVLVAVIDGLGHGVHAAEAARTAGDLIRKNAGESIIRLVQHCDQHLHKTRGVVMSLASINTTDEIVTWLGVGNVDGILFRGDSSQRPSSEFLNASRGVVGARLPALRAAVVPITRGDTLVFVTDGIRSGFDEGLSLIHSPQQIADRILARDGLDTDDALVLVARFEGLNP
jgi:negative regulator of sigma-B (phosphoserine phosphatase)